MKPATGSSACTYKQMLHANNALQSAINSLMPSAKGLSTEVLQAQSVSGGCISDAQRVRIRRGPDEQDLFVKRNDASFLNNFQCEADGLQQLSNADAIRIPTMLAVGHHQDQAWLITQWIDEDRSQASSEEFFVLFANQLSQLHRKTLHHSTSGQQIGWPTDNYLGATRQPNAATDSWAEFVAEHRIGFQMRLAIDQGHRDQNLEQNLSRIVSQMDTILSDRADETSLLHGDLWSGNYLSDRNGQPVIIDPAVYRGCREAEFGMLKLFGSCPAVFYETYQAIWPMPDGWQRRVDVYILYHLLNHLNLFGSSYLGQCKSLAAKILSTD